MLAHHETGLRAIFYLPWIRDQLTAAIALAPGRADLYEELARVQMPMGDLAGARVSLDKALELEPKRASALELLRKLGQSE
jgi:cytochrome c-type biogenesis protein CcmH/NrfG